MPVWYLQGNHDGDRAALEAFLPLRYHDALCIGPSILVAHGHWVDPRNQPRDRAAFWGARVHALLERVIRSPVRIPMRHHYRWSTRLGHFLFYQYGQCRRATSALRRALGDEAGALHDLAFLDYWGRGEWGDVHGLLDPAQRLLATAEYHTLVLGHSWDWMNARRPSSGWATTHKAHGASLPAASRSSTRRGLARGSAPVAAPGPG